MSRPVRLKVVGTSVQVFRENVYVGSFGSRSLLLLLHLKEKWKNDDVTHDEMLAERKAIVQGDGVQVVNGFKIR